MKTMLMKVQGFLRRIWTWLRSEKAEMPLAVAAMIWAAGWMVVGALLVFGASGCNELANPYALTGCKAGEPCPPSDGNGSSASDVSKSDVDAYDAKAAEKAKEKALLEALPCLIDPIRSCTYAEINGPGSELVDNQWAKEVPGKWYGLQGWSFGNNSNLEVAWYQFDDSCPTTHWRLMNAPSAAWLCIESDGSLSLCKNHAKGQTTCIWPHDEPGQIPSGWFAGKLWYEGGVMYAKYCSGDALTEPCWDPDRPEPEFIKKISNDAKY